MIKDQTKIVMQALKEQEESNKSHTQLLEKSVKEVHSQEILYAEIVKGTCTEAVKKVSEKISTVPETPASSAVGKDMRSIAKLFDDFIDKDRRKNNLVVHNLPEAEGSSHSERSSGDIRLFQEVCEDTFKVSVSVSRAFRVGRADTNRGRLLIVLWRLLE